MTNHPGDIKFEDLNGNGYIDRGQNTVDDPGDRKIIANEEPRYIYSFTLKRQIGTISRVTLPRGWVRVRLVSV